MATMELSHKGRNVTEDYDASMTQGAVAASAFTRWRLGGGGRRHQALSISKGIKYCRFVRQTRKCCAFHLLENR